MNGPGRGGAGVAAPEPPRSAGPCAIRLPVAPPRFALLPLARWRWPRCHWPRCHWPRCHWPTCPFPPAGRAISRSNHKPNLPGARGETAEAGGNNNAGNAQRCCVPPCRAGRSTRRPRRHAGPVTASAGAPSPDPLHSLASLFHTFVRQPGDPFERLPRTFWQRGLTPASPGAILTAGGRPSRPGRGDPIAVRTRRPLRRSADAASGAGRYAAGRGRRVEDL